MGSFSVLSWASLNPAVATVEDGLVTAVGAGETIVTVATANGLTASCTFIVNVFPTQLSLNSYELQLIPGESFQLIPSVDQGETSYSYWSDDPESVSVDANGLITAIREWGSCIHVATSNGLQAECWVSVPQMPTMVTIDPASISMGVGQTFQLHAWVDQGEGAITYASSDPFVVTVDENGLATAVGSGTAEIIATSVNGLTAGCTVNVASSAAILTPEMDEKLHADLQAAIDEIMNSDSEIVHSDVYIPGETYTGRAYYISNDGDDNNDGLTPETAWRTMFKLNYEINWGENRVVKSGDIIYFRRGDTFRLNDGDVNAVNTNIMPTTDGITFSAYGEGPKPIITASSENGSGAEKWELAYEDASGAKIWKYYRDLMDTSTVVCNDGEALTNRVYEWWDGDEYVSCTCDEWLMDANTGVDLLDGLLSLGDTLTEDMSIVSRPVVSDDDKGPLYFRCDAGNPGAIYESIEFSEKEINGIVWLLVNDTVFDNISFRCNGNSYIKNGVDFGNDALKNTVIQNCEFAYGGGSVSFYGIKDGGNFVAAQGDGIYNVVDNATIRNNYFHDAPCSTATFESPLDGTGVQHSGYYHVLENVMVNTIGLRLDSSFAPYSYLDSVVIRGNQIWNTGHMDRGQYYYSEGGINLFASHHDEIIVEDNVIYGTENGHPRNALLNLDFFDSDYFSEPTVPQLIRNTYVQYAGRDFAYFEMQNEKHWLIDAADTVAKAIEWFGDTLSRFFIKQ